jgi:hypothetical protein
MPQVDFWRVVRVIDDDLKAGFGGAEERLDRIERDFTEAAGQLQLAFGIEALLFKEEHFVRSKRVSQFLEGARGQRLPDVDP